MALQYLFLIGGNDVTSLVVKANIGNKRALGIANTAKITIQKSILDSYTLSVGDEVVFSRGETTSTDDYIFRGNVTKSELVGIDMVYTCRDPINKLDSDFFTASYDININTEAGVVSEIFKDICEDGGVSVSVEDSSLLATLNKFISYDNSRLERMVTLTKFLGWTFYYDYNLDLVKLEPKGFNSYATALSSATNIFNNMIWDEDLESMRNNIKIRGAYDEDTRVELKSGNASDVDFVVANTPLITEVEYPIGTLLIRGVVGSSSNYDYTVDADTNTITFVSAPASASNNISIQYTTRIPRPVQGVNQSSIDAYGVTNGAVFSFDDILDLDDAENRLASLLEILGPAKITTVVHTDTYGIKPNDVVSIIDESNTKYTGDYIVYGTTIVYPTQFDLITVGDVNFSINDIINNISLRIRLLEQRQSPTSDILRQVINTDRTITRERRYLYSEIKNVAGATGIYGHGTLGLYGTAEYGAETAASFVLGHSVYGILGTSELGESGVATWGTLRLMQGNNTYKEYVTDDVFYDSSSSTGITWNSTTKVITFAADGVMVSEVLAKGMSYNTFTLSVGTITGDLSYELSTDNGVSWTTMVLSEVTTIASGNNLLLRITEDSTAVASIENVYDSNGDYSSPAIKIVMEEV